MTSLQIDSVAEPFRSHPELTQAAFRFLFSSEFAGLLPAGTWRALDMTLMSSVGEHLLESSKWIAAIELKTASDQLSRPGGSPDQLDRYRHLLERLQTELEGSPRPDGEWSPVVAVLGEDLVGQLVGTSVSSLRRYSSGERSTPQDIAERLHFLALLLGELAGSFNDYGMRRWFARPRQALEGRAPADFMGKDFQPDSAAGEAIRSLAESVRAA